MEICKRKFIDLQKMVCYNSTILIQWIKVIKYKSEAYIMSIPNEYLNSLMERVIARDPNQPEFHQAVREVLTSLSPVVDAHPE